MSILLNSISYPKMRKQPIHPEYFNTLRYSKSQEFPFGSIPHFERWANPNRVQIERQQDYKDYFNKKFKDVRSEYRNKALGFYLCNNRVYSCGIMLRLRGDIVLQGQKRFSPYAKRDRRFYQRRIK